MATGGTLVTNVVANTTGFRRGMKGARSSMSKTQKAAKALGVAFKAMTGLFVAAGAAVVSSVVHFAAFGDELDKMAGRTGVSVESLSKLKFAAEQSGSSLAGVEKGVRGMQRSLLGLEQGLSTQQKAFSALGISLDDIRNKRPEDQFLQIVSALGNIKDASTQAGLSLQIFGRAGSELLPFIQAGEKGIGNLLKQAEELGLVVTTAQAKEAAKFTDAVNAMKRQFQGLGIVIASELVPPLTDLVKKLSKLIKDAKEVGDFFSGGLGESELGEGRVAQEIGLRQEIARREQQRQDILARAKAGSESFSLFGGVRTAGSQAQVNTLATEVRELQAQLKALLASSERGNDIAEDNVEATESITDDFEIGSML